MKRTQALVFLLLCTYTVHAAAPGQPALNDKGVIWILAWSIVLSILLFIVFNYVSLRRLLRECKRQNTQLTTQLSDSEIRNRSLNDRLTKALQKQIDLQFELGQLRGENYRREQLLQKTLQKLENITLLQDKRKRFQAFTPTADTELDQSENLPETVVPEKEEIVFEEDANENNNEFITRITAFMKENIDNAELNIEEFAKHQNISRSNLYRQIKAATGLTPVEFMHKVRITHSIELMKNDYTFSQIAYMTGFNDPKYFSKCFKKYIGMTPTEYKERRLS